MPKGCPEFKRKPLFKRKQKGVSIMPNKLTDAEVKKALGGAILNAKGYDSKVWSIEVYKLENALDLINRLQAKIVQTTQQRDFFAKQTTEQKNTIDKQEAEIERLKTAFDNQLLTSQHWKRKFDELAEENDWFHDTLETTKSDAYTEFAERLKEKADRGFWQEHSYVDVEDIDNLLNELVGENDA